MKVSSTEVTISGGPNHRSGIRRYLWIVWAIGLALAGPVALVLFWTFAADSSLGVIPLFLGWVMAAVAGLNVAIFSGIAGRWGRAIAAGMLPLSLVLSLLAFETVWSFAIAAGEDIHFRLMRASYRAEIARLPTDKGPRAAVFMLSEDGGMGISNLHLVVYDESDEILLSEVQRSSAWTARFAKNWPEIIHAAYVRPLADHFYIVRVSF